MPVRALNLYYARDDSARAQVLATRLRATAVRQSIGVARGRVFVRANGTSALPDVMWDCPFPNAGAHDVDMRARAASAEFEACRALMRTLTRRFERVIYDEIENLAAQEVGSGERMLQLWLAGSVQPDFTDLRSLPATVLQRSDDNASLPDWIVELPLQGFDERAIDAWSTGHAALQVTRVTWQRAG